MNKPPLILALGEILWDMLPTGKQLGGAPANFAFHAAQLGARAGIISAVGDDELGREILSKLSSLDVSLALDAIAIDPVHPTGTVSVSLDAGQPTYAIHENVAWDFISATPAALELTSQADCICFGTLAQRSLLSRESIHTLLRAARDDCLIILDINLRQHYYNRDVLDHSLRAAHVLKLNSDEVIPLLTLLAEHETVVESLLAVYSRLKVIAITRGSQGSILIPRDSRPLHHDGFQPERIADTIGAGDAFTAALAIGLLSNLPLETIHDNANRLASFVCTQTGAMPRLPHLFF